MADTAIVTDSSCGLGPDAAREYDVSIVPILLNWEGRSLRDGVDITADEVYSRLRSDPSLVLSSASPSVGDFLAVYDRLLAEGKRILSIHIAGSLTAVVEVARQAAETRAPAEIEVVDSRAASMGLGFAVLAAARLTAGGATLREAADAARMVGERSHLFGVLETLKYVRHSGRLMGLGMKAGSTLRLRPLLRVHAGEVRLAGMERTRARGVAKVLRLVAEVSGDRPIRASVVHAGVREEAEELAARVAAQENCIELITSEFTPVMGGHTGPGFLGVAFYVEEAGERDVR